jgi:hypothetical protein
MVLDPPVLVASAALGASAVQLVLARWRDLGPLTVTSWGLALLLGDPSPRSLVALALSSALAAAGWARGAARGIGHPALDGAAIGAAALAVAAAGLVPTDAARAAAGASLALVGATLTALALRRPGARRPGVRWIGEIPIRGR